MTTSELIHYLENLTFLAKNDCLPDESKRDLTLMYIRHLYTENVKKEEKEDAKNLSYISLGWYIHNFLLPTINE